MERQAKVKTAFDFNLSHKKPRSDSTGREAIPYAEKRSHISLAYVLAEAKAYSYSGSMRRCTRNKTTLAFDLSYKQ
ncbi:hypothetical protein M0802_016941 [Mischocyttarus mexicanus]|nr:hypothetical protein M0802_016941 [Mischocyttarus mexicanus]